MNDAIIWGLFMAAIILMFGISMFRSGHKILGVAVFIYVVMAIGFTTLLIYDKNVWAFSLIAIWSILTISPLKNQIERWLNKIIF
jgi:hypothetical protein